MIGRDGTAAIFGASGGIGGALAARCREEGFADVVCFARRGGDGFIAFDVTREETIAEAVTALRGRPALRLAVVATGVLAPDEAGPEKTYRALEAGRLETMFRINAIGPALVAKHVLPLLATSGRAVFAALSARVGSIADNRLGGWHGYRASKAALNMMVRNLAIEVGRRYPEQVCVALHPGTVATALSAPFARTEVMAPAQSAMHLLRVLDGVTPEVSGRCLDWRGEEIPG